MVFQKPNPFPKSIYDNVAYGPRINGVAQAGSTTIVESALDLGGAVGRGQGQAEEDARSRSRAASSSGCASPAAIAVQARRDPDGRAVLGARPDRDVSHRRPHDRSQARLHDRDRDPQHAAGRARVRHDRRSSPPRSTTSTARGRLVEYDAHRKDLHRPTDPRTEGYITGQVRMSVRLAWPPVVTSLLRRRRVLVERASAVERRVAALARAAPTVAVGRGAARRRDRWRCIAELESDARATARRPRPARRRAAGRDRRRDGRRPRRRRCSCATRPRAASAARATGDAVAAQAIGELLDQALARSAAPSASSMLFGPPRQMLHLRAFPLPREGAPSGAVAFVRDVTEARRIESMRRDFVANVSHELQDADRRARGARRDDGGAERRRRSRSRLAERDGARERAARAHRRRPARPQHVEAQERAGREPIPVARARRRAVDQVRWAAEAAGIAIDASNGAAGPARSTATAARCGARSSTCSTTR